MRIPKRAWAAASAAAIAALLMALAAGAFGATGNSQRHDPTHHGKRHGIPVLKAALAPSQPTDPALHGVAAGGAPWVLKFGEVRLKSNGHLDLRVKGLVIPSLGNTGPVTTIAASLYCGADSDTTAVATTQQVRISHSGNARIHDTSFTVPSTCLAPVILVHPNGLQNLYIALNGWRQ
jgi:hypothetical protein